MGTRHLLRHFVCLLFLVSGLLIPAGVCAKVKTVKPEKRGMDPVRLSRVDAVIEDAIRAGETPGAVLSVVRNDDIVYLTEL